MTRKDPLITDGKAGGITESASWAPSHRLRHVKHAQAQITGFKPSSKFHSGEAFGNRPQQGAGEGWKKVDSDHERSCQGGIG